MLIFLALKQTVPTKRKERNVHCLVHRTSYTYLDRLQMSFDAMRISFGCFISISWPTATATNVCTAFINITTQIPFHSFKFLYLFRFFFSKCLHTPLCYWIIKTFADMLNLHQTTSIFFLIIVACRSFLFARLSFVLVSRNKTKSSFRNWK